MKATIESLFETCPDSGSKKRFRSYQATLSRDPVEKPLFDSRIRDVLEKYAFDKDDLHKTIDYLNHLRDDEGRLFSRSLREYSSLEDQVKRFAEPDYTSFRHNINYQACKKMWIEKFSKWHLQCLSYHSDQDMKDALPKTDTNAGWTQIISGIRTKGGNMEGVHSVWIQEVSKLSETHSFGKPILIASRTQASGEFTEKGEPTGKCKHKTRLVSMVDLIVILAECMFAVPFQRRFAGSLNYAGGKSDTRIHDIIMDTRIHFHDFISLDYSHYDQSISRWLIEDVAEIIKSAFDKFTPEQELIWDAVWHDFVVKDFVMDGYTVHAKKGVPSGSMFTQIVDSLANMLMISTYFHSLGDNHYTMLVMGDDNLIYHNRGEEESLKLCSYIRKNFGIEVNEGKTSTGDRDDDPEFLSRFWKSRGQWRHPHSLISRMLFPERFRAYDKEGFTPEEVFYSYVLAYGIGMREYFDVDGFVSSLEFSRIRRVWDHVRYLTGFLRYREEYLVAY
jgi:hypothetical protein